MDEVLRRGIRALMQLPEMVSTAEAIEIHRLMAEVLKARSFRINWIIDEIYYDDGSPLSVAVDLHLQKIWNNRETNIHAEMMTDGAFRLALQDKNRVEVFQITYQAVGIYPAQPRMITTLFSLSDAPMPGANYTLRIRENV